MDLHFTTHNSLKRIVCSKHFTTHNSLMPGSKCTAAQHMSCAHAARILINNTTQTQSQACDVLLPCIDNTVAYIVSLDKPAADMSFEDISSLLNVSC